MTDRRKYAQLMMAIAEARRTPELLNTKKSADINLKRRRQRLCRCRPIFGLCCIGCLGVLGT